MVLFKGDEPLSSSKPSPADLLVFDIIEVAVGSREEQVRYVQW